MTTAPNIEMIASLLRHCSLNGGRRRAGRGRGGGDDSESVTVELNSDRALPYHWEQCLDIRTGQVYYINWEDGTRTTVDPRTSAFTSSPTPRTTSSISRRSRRASTPSSGYTSVSSVGADEEVVAAWPHVGDNMDSGYDNDNEEDDDADDEDEDDVEEEEEEEEEESSSTTSSSSSSTGSSRGSVVSSTLSSFSPTDESASGDNGSAIGAGDNNNHGGAAGPVLVAAGCRACFMYFMVPKRADVCPKCGSSGLLHLSRNGYAS
ncbi:hypothetical protein PR202_gb08616 [Eleusine coracana subsp. coracana]|uniref:Uncharacterized protein n=1 Tax=Eleusine coracana subsp. coracana TaxID=191504 RepID=A0AAV5ECM7_ELECO|nr:hypothetical protein QOZ80_2BG0187560 [Eleusine coracana subsp. coracana]GJN21163.1 hypothetical protein PR202_gb08616 [Eleusine coracana subsp. coracana]